MTEDQHSDLTWLARNLRTRVRECDPLTCEELGLLATMLECIREGRGACAAVLQFPRRHRFIVVEGDRK